MPRRATRTPVEVTETPHVTFNIRLYPAAQRALEALRRLKLPAGATPVPKGHIIERALLALAEAEGIDITVEG